MLRSEIFWGKYFLIFCWFFFFVAEISKPCWPKRPFNYFTQFPGSCTTKSSTSSSAMDVSSRKANTCIFFVFLFIQTPNETTNHATKTTTSSAAAAAYAYDFTSPTSISFFSTAAAAAETTTATTTSDATAEFTAKSVTRAPSTDEPTVDSSISSCKSSHAYNPKIKHSSIGPTRFVNLDPFY